MVLSNEQKLLFIDPRFLLTEELIQERLQSLATAAPLPAPTPPAVETPPPLSIVKTQTPEPQHGFRKLWEGIKNLWG